MFTSRGAQGRLPAAMPPEQVTYEWFADTYHFTEEMTDNLSLDALEWWPLIRVAKAKAADTERRQQERVANASAKRPVNGPRM